jgi:hypothetical protein
VLQKAAGLVKLEGGAGQMEDDEATEGVVLCRLYAYIYPASTQLIGILEVTRHYGHTLTLH